MKEMKTKKTGCCETRHYHDAHGSSKVICLNKACENYLGYTNASYVSKKHFRVIAVAIAIFATAFFLNDYPTTSHSNHISEASILFSNAEFPTPLTLENLALEIQNHGILCEDVVLAQMRIESGNLESFLLKKTNNMLGMRFPFQRNTTATGMFIPSKDTIIYGTQDDLRKYGRMNNYAVYDEWQDAVADYKMWQDYCFNTQKAYINFLGRVYAEDPGYVAKIKKMTDISS
jgi:mannosyl-glycoprotein endo-beta-N-acetylglucosaminidase